MAESRFSTVRWFAYLAATGIFWTAYATLRTGSVRLARQLFLLAHTISPRHTLPLRYLAWCLRETGDSSRAIAYYTELLEMCPDYVEGRVELGFTLGGLARYPEALEQFDRALAFAPQDSAARGARAAMMICIRHFADAIPVCEDLVRDEPDDAVVWGWLGRARAEVDEWEAAVFAYETAQGLRSDVLVAAEYAGVQTELNRFADAEAVLRKAMTAHGPEPALDVQLALVFAEQRRFGEAERLLEDALRRDSSNRRARSVRSSVFADSSRLSEAADIGAALVAENPAEPDGHATLGWIALKSERFEDALAAFESALGIEPSRWFAAGRATALARLGRQSEAQDIVRCIIDRDPAFSIDTGGGRSWGCSTADRRDACGLWL